MTLSPIESADPEAPGSGSAPSAVAPGRTQLSAGTVLSDLYRIEDLVGEGGFGSVYRAKHIQLGHHVAIKLLRLPADREDADVAMRQFHQEAILGARIRSANLIEVIDAGETPQGTPFLVMSLVRGPTLGALLSEVEVLPAGAVVDIGIQVAAGLAVLDANDVVHRDIKPHNIALERDAGGSITVKLLDFGISRPLNSARVSAAPEPAGTPRYMAPEQIRGSAADARSDLYSLGCVLFEALSGRAPRPGESLTRQISSALQGESAPPVHSAAPNAPRELAEIIDRLLSDAPEERPATALEVRDQLEKAAETAGLPRRRAAWAPVPVEHFGTERLDAGERLETITNPFTSTASRSRRVASWAAILALLVGGLAIAAHLVAQASPTDVGPKGVTTIEVPVE